jgi:hypothetical protein
MRQQLCHFKSIALSSELRQSVARLYRAPPTEAANHSSATKQKKNSIFDCKQLNELRLSIALAHMIASPFSHIMSAKIAQG